MLYYQETIVAENRQQARDLLATNLGFAGGKQAQQALKSLSDNYGK